MRTEDAPLARPLFTWRETARYVGVPKSTIREFGQPPAGRSTLITALPRHGPEATVPFVGFAEAYVLATFRRAGVPMQRIRPAVEALSREIGIEHALVSRSLCTHGAEALFDYAEQRGDDDVRGLVVVRDGQRQFSELIRDYLRCITYGDDGWATQVRLPTYGRADVVVDPHVAFGLPIVIHGGARVEDLVDRFLAGDTTGDIAYAFEVPVDQAEHIIRVATRTAPDRASGAPRQRP